MNPGTVPIGNAVEMMKFRQWVKTETQKLADQEIAPTISLRKQILAAWTEYHPAMMAELNKLGIAQDFADLMQAKMWEAQEAYQKAGMRWPDSREEAAREWLMMYPPEEPEETDEIAELPEYETDD